MGWRSPLLSPLCSLRRRIILVLAEDPQQRRLLQTLNWRFAKPLGFLNCTREFSVVCFPGCGASRACESKDKAYRALVIPRGPEQCLTMSCSGSRCEDWIKPTTRDGMERMRLKHQKERQEEKDEKDKVHTKREKKRRRKGKKKPAIRQIVRGKGLVGHLKSTMCGLKWTPIKCLSAYSESQRGIIYSRDSPFVMGYWSSPNLFFYTLGFPSHLSFLP